MPVVIEQRIEVKAAPAAVFRYLIDPARRPDWDSTCDLCRLDGERAAVGVQMQLTGRRMAPSWVGRYVTVEPARRASIELVKGAGMPFRSYLETLAVRARGGGTEITLRIEYEAAGLVRLIEPITLRSRLRREMKRSAGNLQAQFG